MRRTAIVIVGIKRLIENEVQTDRASVRGNLTGKRARGAWSCPSAGGSGVEMGFHFPTIQTWIAFALFKGNDQMRCHTSKLRKFMLIHP